MAEYSDEMKAAIRYANSEAKVRSGDAEPCEPCEALRAEVEFYKKYCEKAQKSRARAERSKRAAVKWQARYRNERDALRAALEEMIQMSEEGFPSNYWCAGKAKEVLGK